MSDEKTVEERIAELHERRQANLDAHKAAHQAQYLEDLEALVALEEEHGVERLLKVEIRGWKADSGAVTMVIAKRPRKSDALLKRFIDMSRRSKKGEKLDDGEVDKAGELLANSCIVYPAVPKKGDPSPDPAYDATIELAPGLLLTVAGALVTAAMGKAEEEGKG